MAPPFMPKYTAAGDPATSASPALAVIDKGRQIQEGPRSTSVGSSVPLGTTPNLTYGNREFESEWEQAQWRPRSAPRRPRSAPQRPRSVPRRPRSVPRRPRSMPRITWL
ncbi:hypothetical protein GBAR_LOCUS12923 [Geodia barretti]|uniref:Uncharacterized protein n=1 Tax=Geodia barretti TaxID=519541 RepID=A0AA35S1Y1_GEOBA|nr:hypothetical protein GBAR_LOCUS12923 [Geodia barretti]